MTKTNGQKGNSSITNASSRFNPYVGPRPFLPGEELFGRDREIRDLLDQLLAERIVLLHSPSGAGKTSLVNAGLLPMLHEEGLLVLPVVRVGEEPDEKYTELDGFNRYIFSMMISLDGEMEESSPEQDNTGEVKGSIETRQTTQAAQRQARLDELAGMHLKEYLDLRRQMLDTNLNVIIFDQFEEIITTSPTDLVGKQDFFNQLGDALRDRSLWALFVIRDDFLGALEPFKLSIPTQFTNTFRLDLLEKKAAQQAIQKPVARQGITFQESAAERLVDDLRIVQIQAPGGEIVSQEGIYVEPVQLQVVCFRLYDELDLANRLDKIEIDDEDINNVGDVGTALSNYYAERVAVIARSRNVERQVRDWFDRQLITKSGLRSQVMMEVGASAGLDNNLIRQLVKSHLVRAEKRRGVTWFELAHDRLIDPVRSDNASWSKNNLILLQRQADLWDQQRRPESMLLRENELIEAKRWAADHRGVLQPIEEKFLSESISHEQRAKRLRAQRWMIVAFFGFLIGVVAITSAFLAIQQRRINIKLLYYNLVNQAKFYQAEQYDLALLLSWKGYLASINRTDIQEPRISLLNMLQAHPGLITNLQGHAKNATVTDVAFNPRARILASAGGGDHTIILWNVSYARQPTELYQFTASSSTISSLAFSPDGNTLASGSNDNKIRLWDLGDLNQLVKHTDPISKTLEGHTKEIMDLAYSPNGGILASAGKDKTIHLWDVSDLQSPKSFDLPLKGYNNTVRSVAFSPDSNILASGSCGKVEKVSGANQCIEGEIRLWDVSDPSKPVQLASSSEGHTDNVLSLVFSPDGDTLASGSIDKTILLWDVRDPRQPKLLTPALKEHTDEVKSVSFSPDGKTLVSGGDDNVIRLWNVDAESDEFGKHLMELSGHPGAILSVAFDPYKEANILASGGGQGAVILWELDESYQPVQSLQLGRLKNELGEISVMASIADGKILASTGSDGYDIQLWKLVLGDPRHLAQLGTSLNGHASQVQSLAFSPDGKILASGSCGKVRKDSGANQCVEGEIRLWDVSDPSKPFQLASSSEGLTGDVLSLAFHPDGGNILASGSCGKVGEVSGAYQCVKGEIRLWDVSIPSKPVQLASSSEGLADNVLGLAFSPDGNTLASGGSDNKIRLWDVSDHSKLSPLSPVLEGHTNKVNYLTFSPDGEILASGSEDTTIRLWDVNPSSSSFGERLGDPLKSHGDSVNSLTFSPDGRTLASGSDDDTIRFWDMRNPRVPIEYEPSIRGHTGNVVSLAFSPDGKFLVSGGADDTIRLWCTNVECWREIICLRAGRNLTLNEWGSYFPQENEEDYYKDKICPQYPIDMPPPEPNTIQTVAP